MSNEQRMWDAQDIKFSRDINHRCRVIIVNSAQDGNEMFPFDPEVVWVQMQYKYPVPSLLHWLSNGRFGKINWKWDNAYTAIELMIDFDDYNSSMATIELAILELSNRRKADIVTRDEMRDFTDTMCGE